MKRLWIVCALALSWACDQPAPPVEPTEPPKWVKEAVERSQQQAEEAEPDEQEAELLMERPLLWRVKTEDGATSYLLGSFHIGTDFHGLRELPTSLQTAFDESKTVVLEADTGLADPGPIMKYVALPKGQSLRKMLKPPQWETLIKELRAPAAQLEQTQPWVVSAQLATAWIPDAGTRGMDDRLRILGRAHEKELVFLETMLWQAELMSKISPPEMLAEMLDEAAEAKVSTRKALADFRRGDAAALSAWAFEPEALEKYPRFFEKLFFERNAKWSKLLKPRLDAGGVLVVVGAGHLLGDKSLVARLGAQGYQVERVE